MTYLRISLLVLLLSGCEQQPSVTFPKSACVENPTGQIRHQHRNAYMSQNIFPQSDKLAVFHASYHPRVRHIPVYHPAQDWDEIQIATTCSQNEWRRK